MVYERLGAVAGGGGEEGVGGVGGEGARVVAEEVAEVEGWGDGFGYCYGAEEGGGAVSEVGERGSRRWIYDLSGFEALGAELRSVEEIACGTSIVESSAMTVSFLDIARIYRV